MKRGVLRFLFRVFFVLEKKSHSQQCLRYVNADRHGLGVADYRDDLQEWDGQREICGAMIFRGYLCDWFLITHMILQEQSVAQCK